MAIVALKCFSECSPTPEKSIFSYKALCRAYCTTANETNITEVYHDLISTIDLAYNLIVEAKGALDSMEDHGV